MFPFHWVRRKEESLSVFLTGNSKRTALDRPMAWLRLPFSNAEVRKVLGDLVEVLLRVPRCWGPSARYTSVGSNALYRPGYLTAQKPLTLNP